MPEMTGGTQQMIAQENVQKGEECRNVVVLQMENKGGALLPVSD